MFPCGPVVVALSTISLVLLGAPLAGLALMAYRMVLVLRDMEGLSAREVGAVMGLTERAVKSRLHRARLFVRHELTGQRAGETGPPPQAARPRADAGRPSMIDGD